MSEKPPAASLFGFDRDHPDPLKRLLIRTWAPHVERLLALDFLQQTYESVAAGQRHDVFVREVLGQMDVGIACTGADLSRIPRQGPLVVVANHPFGGLEGMLLAQLLLGQRPDVRILANYMLERIPELRELFVFVDPWARDASRPGNARALREIMRHLRGGGVLGVFPAGEVAHRKPGDGGVVREPPWQAAIGHIVQRTRAPVLPVYFHGDNSPLFHRAGMLHPSLRTVLLPRELKNKRGSRIEVRIGEPIATDGLHDHDPQAFIDHLRQRTEALRSR